MGKKPAIAIALAVAIVVFAAIMALLFANNQTREKAYNEARYGTSTAPASSAVSK